MMVAYVSRIGAKSILLDALLVWNFFWWNFIENVAKKVDFFCFPKLPPPESTLVGLNHSFNNCQLSSRSHGVSGDSSLFSSAHTWWQSFGNNLKIPWILGKSVIVLSWVGWATWDQERNLRSWKYSEFSSGIFRSKRPSDSIFCFFFVCFGDFAFLAGF